MVDDVGVNNLSSSKELGILLCVKRRVKFNQVVDLLLTIFAFTANTSYALQENESFNIELSDTLESDIVFTSDVYGYIDADYVITVKEVCNKRAAVIPVWGSIYIITVQAITNGIILFSTIISSKQ